LAVGRQSPPSFSAATVEQVCRILAEALTGPPIPQPDGSAEGAGDERRSVFSKTKRGSRFARQSILAPMTAGDQNRWPDWFDVRQVRIARPTDRLEEVVRPYRDVLGLPELFRFAGHAG
jgi:YycE-like protein